MDRMREQRKAQMKKESLLTLILRDISNPWLLEEKQFINSYRLTSHLVKLLVDLLHEDVKPKICSKYAIPSHLRVFIAIRFYAQGPYQLGLSKNYKHPCSQSSVSKIINKVTNALIKHSEKFINFPQTRERRVATEKRFAEVGACEGTLGLIDCTMVHLCRPCTAEEAYFNHRHGCHCISCEVVCDADYLVLSLNPFPGSNADPFLYKHSKCSGKMFNEMLTHTRCRVEQLFGQLKGRWRCLNKERMLHYHPKKACKIIVACVVLHNFAKLGGVPIAIQHSDDLGHYNYCRNLFSYEAGLQEKKNLIRRCYG
ncbi:hypothetical protein QAD02_002851 [Eretmocerus hayati]|uniref:Uncharacterized protein n=1 Tax=Eretmocerus hayati TaxID=131215 RepID=A0ACC2NMZ4_9HYME|nr:hypothetical protein QAD02_002851 [Eretmocerus hayati]